MSSAAIVLTEPSALIPAGRVWSELQDAIFEHRAKPENTQRNLVVEALAGTGKSTTIEELVLRIPAQRRVGVFAFNKAIADSMRTRLDDPSIDVRTWHSFGMAALHDLMPQLKVDTKQALTLLSRQIGPGGRKEKAFILKLLGLAKGALSEPRDLEELADNYGLFPPRGSRPDRLFALAKGLLKQQAQRGRKVIDFDDMIWLPIVWGLELPQYDDVVVDEAQDLNPAQLEMALRTAASGRLTAVGDRHQSIYQFRGADSQAMPKIIEATGADLLPLSITYRCSQAVVREANRYVPELRAADGAPEGKVRLSNEDELFEFAGPGDFVLSRLNAPLVKLAYQWLRSGVACEIKGRNIGADLISFIESLKARSIEELKMLVREWRDEIENDDSKTDRARASADDRAECVLGLCSEAESITVITDKIEEMFSDSEGDSSKLITLSSTHKAKGLEADRVWILRDTYSPGTTEEETNLLYVAITRAKTELIYVTKDSES